MSALFSIVALKAHLVASVGMTWSTCTALNKIQIIHCESNFFDELSHALILGVLAVLANS